MVDKMKIKTKLYIQARKTTYDEGLEIHAYSYKTESDVFGVVIDIDETEVEVECPDFSQEDFTNGHVEQLRKVKEQLLFETHQKAKSIDEQIESLLAIENKA